MSESLEIRRLFSGAVTFAGAVASSQTPFPAVPTREVLFAGKSNVGKSSLINAITRQGKLARTSGGPGCTAQINFFNVCDKLTLTDVPGYGYASVSKAQRRRWEGIVEYYLSRRSANVAMAFVLVDIRRGVSDQDAQLASRLTSEQVPWRFILTKADKISAGNIEEAKEMARLKAEILGSSYRIVATTAKLTDPGISELRNMLAWVAAAKGDIPIYDRVD